MKRIYLSSPHLSGLEVQFLQEALESGWIAPLGPQVEAFEQEFAEVVGAPYALALSSGTAAIHLALILAGVGPGDEVAVSTLTFAASAFPVLYLGAKPVFVDSERTSWNMDPGLLAEFLEARAKKGKLPKAVVLVHLYGQSADIDAIQGLCQEYGLTLIEDAAEALGSTYKGKSPGTFGFAGIFSFNGNKIITTSGGGMLVSNDEKLIAHARKLATQAREPVPWYEHREVGYNYRMSNLLAAVGRAQLRTLEERVQARRRIYERYVAGLSDLPGLSFQPEAPWGRHTRWLTVMLVDREAFGRGPEEIRQALEGLGIETRPVWKPLHLQPVFHGAETVGGGVAEDLFARGLCLPSGSSLTPEEQDRVIEAIRSLAET
ncbi:spore coat polysaccharide biosynthesis protein SpsC [Thermus thermophilus]|uniref:DegT/DnrJ/EryC1/StrS family aminotransferase n=1 Tax=Thermus thermophilus TaxID=274 RepID=UPI00090AB4D5|nr:aminotransferase class I/II-fold pyridoxal phosphate-dependent enzyme [Thermus thermophilus]BAW01141.1 spore coat polysaccharide biosynthesis protein SpsC [Thermus thermophilus]BDB11808.1 pyridoxal phosphate-dependent aminotransferase [Thermus thermophilus]